MISKGDRQSIVKDLEADDICQWFMHNNLVAIITLQELLLRRGVELQVGVAECIQLHPSPIPDSPE